jgi:rare lipoprotein A
MTATASLRAWQPLLRFIGLAAVLGPLLAACATNHHHVRRGAFTSKEFGVAVSPRVTTSQNPPHGGGRALVGDAYKVHGKWYQPKPDPKGYTVTGQASWYGQDFHGRLTANGEIFNANAISGGSPDLPLPSYARVTNLDNGRSLIVRFNDRGPYMAGRIVDLSEKAATLLGYVNIGTANVKVQYVGPAPLNGDDTRFLMASLDQNGSSRSYDMPDRPQIALASVEPQQIRPLIPPQRAAKPMFAGARMSQVMSSVNSLFSYAEARQEDADINSAHAAVDAMAARVPDLADWRASMDEDARAVRIELGTYSDPAKARDVAMQFAYLGAVDESAATGNDGKPATQLVLTHLKPGVGQDDVRDLVHRLGIDDALRY